MPSVTPLLAADPSRIGRYRLTGRLGERPGESPRPTGGGAGREGPAPFVVYLGRTTDGEPVTVTLLQPVTATDRAARDRFMAEADAARKVAPLCVARMLDAGFHGDFPYLISEYIPGPSLAEAVLAEGPPAEDMLRAVAIGAATGLASIHQAGLVHGHFNAHRLVLGPDGPRVVHSGVTPPFGLATPAADVLAWAHAVLFAAAGRSRGNAAHPGSDDLSLLQQPLRDLVAQCLERDPGARPSAKVIVTRLLGHAQPPTGILAAGSRLAAPARTTVRAPSAEEDEEPPRHVPQRRPSHRAVAVGAAAAVVVAVAALTAVFTLPGGGTRDGPGAQPSQARQATQQASASSGPSTFGATSPTPTAQIPPSLSGDWSGQVTQAVPALTFSAEIKLTAGTTTGSVSYPSFGCSGILTLTSQSDSHFVFQQGIVEGQKTCGQGTVTLSLDGGNLTYRFTPATPGGPSVHGTLSHQ